MSDSGALAGPKSQELTLALVKSGYANLNEMFDRLREQILQRGHRVRVYANDAALLSDPDAWAEIDVLMGVGTFPISEAFLQQSPRLRGVLSAITGVEGFDLELASRHGVVVGNGQVPENSRSVAEATVLMVLASMYDLNGTQALLRNNMPRPLTRSTRILQRQRIGFIGFGRIARIVAELLSGWNVDMSYHARSEAKDAPAGVRRVDLETLLRQSDVVIVLAPLNADSLHLLDERRLGWMKPSALLVNMARGAICDEAALYRCLRDGGIAAAALDTFEVEPLPMDSPLRSLPNVILTPHVIGHTADAYDAIEANALESVLRLMAGKPPPHLLNPQALQRSRHLSA